MNLHIFFHFDVGTGIDKSNFSMSSLSLIHQALHDGSAQYEEIRQNQSAFADRIEKLAATYRKVDAEQDAAIAFYDTKFPHSGHDELNLGHLPVSLSTPGIDTGKKPTEPTQQSTKPKAFSQFEDSASTLNGL
jgi:hypothetical protein